MNRSGFSLIETILYIGLLAMVMTGTVLFSIGLVQKMRIIDPRVRMEEKAALIMQELQHELSGAQSIDVTNSTLGTNPSALQFTNIDGEIMIFDRSNQTVSFIGGDQQVTRMRVQVDTVASWMTDKDLEVNTFQVDVVRDGGNALTGLRITLTLDTLNAQGASEGEGFSAVSTIMLNPQTSEL
jgi:type II secretory pathway component PulJ